MDASSLTSEFARSLNGLVDGLETSQQSVVIVGADLVFLYQVPVEVVQFSIALLHHCPAMEKWIFLNYRFYLTKNWMKTQL